MNKVKKVYEDVGQTPTTVKVYFRLFEVWAIDKLAKEAGMTRGGWIATMVRKRVNKKVKQDG